MNDKLNSAFMDDPEFQSLMVDCMEALQRGESIDRDALREKFPKYADDLDQYLDVLNVLDQFAGGLPQLKPSGDPVSPYGATVTPHIGNSDIESGDTIHYIGEYEVLEEIARGGMGVVFKARQQTLKRIVALKMILSGRLADTAEVDRFKREAQAASRLRHPNIVPVHEIGEHEGRQYFTMDYVDGHSLADEIREESLAPRRAAQLVKTVVQAVHFAHQKGTLHRDLKPANVLVTSDDMPHVTDFGLAKILDDVDDESRAELTASGQILGTPSYMSPEQASGKQNLVGPASDIYSLGAILYACLTGRAPFVADSPVDTLMQVIHKEPVSPRQLNPAVPQDLETICQKCLNKEPHKRYGTAQELADDLERFLEDRPVHARPIGRTARAWRWSKRNPIVATLLILVATSLAAGTAISSYFAVEASNRAVAEKKAKERQGELLAEAQELAGDLKESLVRETELKGEALTAKSLAEQRLTISKRALYALQLSRSHEQWASNPVEALQGLRNENRCPPELRDFCWRYLSRLSERFVRNYPGHQTPFCIDVSSDGKLIAGCFVSRDILIISRETGKSWHVEEKPEKWIKKVAFLPDSHILVAAGDDRNVTVWDALTGKKLHIFEHGEDVRGLAVSFDGQWVATGGKEHTRLWQTSDWEEAKQFPHGSQELTFSRDSRTLIAGSGQKVIFQDLETGETRTWEGQQSMVRGLDVSPDGKLLLSSDLNAVLLRELDTGFIRHRITEPLSKAGFDDVKFSPDGKTFVTTAGTYPIKLWDVQTGQFIAEVAPYIGSTHTVAFLPEGNHIVAPAEHDKSVLNLWKVPRKDPTQTVKRPALWMAASRDSNRLATTDQSKIDIWDFQKGEVIRSWEPSETDDIQGPVSKLEFLPGGAELLSIHLRKDECIAALWNVDSGNLLRRFDNLDWGKAIAYDPVRQRIAVPGAGQVVSVRDFESGEELKILGRYHNELQCVAFSPDGKWLAFGDGWDPLPDGTPPGALRLCNLETGELTPLKGHKRFGIYDLAFSPDGKTLVSVGGGGILWDVPSGRLRARLQGHQSAVFSVDFSTDGKTIATGSMDKTVRLWDPVTGELRLTLEEHPYWVTATEFNHDSTRLVSSSYDGQVKFWNAPASEKPFDQQAP